MKLKTIIIDDENDSRNLLKQFITQYCPNIEVINDFNNPIKALSFLELNFNSIDLIFLDISMPEMDGITFLNKCIGFNLQVIFITAHSEYAIQALRLSALDYILKPISIELLIQASEKAVENYQKQKMIDNQIQNYILNENSNTEEKRILLNKGNDLELVKINDIIYLQADGNYTFVYLLNGTKILMTERIGNLEKLLPYPFFYRCHRSYYINLKHVLKYFKARSGAVLMVNKSELPIAQRSRSQFVELLKKM